MHFMPFQIRLAKPLILPISKQMPSDVLCYYIDFVINRTIARHVQTFAERYQSFAEPCAEAFNDVYDRYAEVVMDEEELNEYRKARREGRARWQGGGFGLAGALSGAVTAGALNLVMGAGHMVFNAIGRTFSSIATSFKLSKIYDDPNTCKTLLKGLRLSVFNLHFALVCCLDELDIDHVPASGLVTPEEHRQGEAILSNVDKLPTEDDKSCGSCLWPQSCRYVSLKADGQGSINGCDIQYYGSTGCLGCGYELKGCYSGISKVEDGDNTTTKVFYGSSDDGSHILTIGGTNNGCVKSGNEPLSSLRDAQGFAGIN